MNNPQATQALLIHTYKLSTTRMEGLTRREHHFARWDNQVQMSFRKIKRPNMYTARQHTSADIMSNKSGQTPIILGNPRNFEKEFGLHELLKINHRLLQGESNIDTWRGDPKISTKIRLQT